MGKGFKKVFTFGKGAEQFVEKLEMHLDELGVDLARIFDDTASEGPFFKVVCISPDLKESVEEMSKSQRGQVVMVRVDEETDRQLDSWVETGAVKSRSEAAALFIREGLHVRKAELDQLEEVLREVKSAKDRLREQAETVLGRKSERE